jgi:O-antigen/teichoic acid export membrane protein
MDAAGGLTSGRRLARNSAVNAAGTVLPAVAGLAAVPLLAHHMGFARLGLLLLAWALVGSFSFLDLGLGRALTQAVATSLGRERADELPGLFWTYLALLAGLGAVALAALATSAQWLIGDVVAVPRHLRGEARTALYALAPATPLVMVGIGLRGYLEAHQRFGMVTAVRLPTTLLMLMGPVVALPFSRSLVVAVAILVASRFIAAVAHLLQCFAVSPQLRRPIRPALATVRQLAGSAGWLTVSSGVGSLIVYLDRFVVAAVVSATAVAFYATPGDVALRLTLIPLALVPVLFPAFATAAAASPRRASHLLASATTYALVLMLPPAILLVSLAHELLDAWVGEVFARESTLVAQLLLTGAFLNGAAQVPLAYVQGTGRADLAAKLHLAELPAFLGGVWLATRLAGIEGAALAWLLRAGLDALALFVMATRLSARADRLPVGALALSSGALAAAWLVAYLPAPALVKAGSAIATVAISGAVAWRRLLDEDARRMVRAALALGRQPIYSPP